MESVGYIYILKELLNGIGLDGHGVWLGNCRVDREGQQEGHAGDLKHELKRESTARISSSEKPQLFYRFSTD